MENTPIKPKAAMIMELGTLQLFHYPDPLMYSGLPPSNVYWQDTLLFVVQGPFTGVHEAMSHYTAYIIDKRTGKTTSIENVIPVDFKSKKRILK